MQLYVWESTVDTAQCMFHATLVVNLVNPSAVNLVNPAQILGESGESVHG